MSASLLGHHHSHHPGVIQRLPAAAKLAAGLILVTGTVLAPEDSRTWFIGVALVLALAILLSRLPLLFLLKRLVVLSPFVLGVALVNALSPAGRANWQILAVKSGLCLLTILLVSNTTPFSRILRVLKSIQVPALLITTMALMYRYLFVLVDEAERMRRARASRTFTRTRRFRWHILATMLGQLFVRASERAERIYDAMCARGWK